MVPSEDEEEAGRKKEEKRQAEEEKKKRDEEDDWVATDCAATHPVKEKDRAFRVKVLFVCAIPKELQVDASVLVKVRFEYIRVTVAEKVSKSFCMIISVIHGY